jgi:hypothetical protein
VLPKGGNNESNRDGNVFAAQGVHCRAVKHEIISNSPIMVGIVISEQTAVAAASRIQ